MTTHTPGPWFLKNHREIHDKDTHFDENGARIGSTANLIATVDHFNTEANAQLIASAPELLAACIQARAALPDRSFADDATSDVVDLLNAAITKATGNLDGRSE